jgi:hypothetical protein
MQSYVLHNHKGHRQQHCQKTRGLDFTMAPCYCSAIVFDITTGENRNMNHPSGYFCLKKKSLN